MKPPHAADTPTDTPVTEIPSPTAALSVPELTAVFLRLGFTAFGGPAAHIALMKDEFVVRRRCLTEAEFLDLLGAANLVPGPSSTELAIHLGYRFGGPIGLLLAGACFIVPAALIVAAFAAAYVRFGALPQTAALLYAIKPVVVAVVLQAIWGLLRPAVKSRFLGILGAAVLVLALLGCEVAPLLFGAGTVSGVIRWSAFDRGQRSVRSLLILLLGSAAFVVPAVLITHSLRAPAAAAATGGEAAAVPFALPTLFLFFLKVGAVLYGSGYVLLAFLRQGLVQGLHWLRLGQVLDAVAVGQVTPGPVFTTATFIGYVLGGPVGAVVATLAIFLPSFVFVAVNGRLIPRIRRSPLMSAFLDGVNVAAIALMTAVTWDLARAAIRDTLTAGIAAAAAILLIRFRVNSAWVILGAAALGIALSLFRPF